MLFVLNLFVDFVFLWTLGPWPWSEATYLWALGPGAKRLFLGKPAPEVGDHFLLLKVSEKYAPGVGDHILLLKVSENPVRVC